MSEVQAAADVEVNEEELLEMREIFQMPGWKHIMARVDEALENSNKVVWNLKDDREIATLQGNVHTLKWISAQEQMVEHMLANVEEEDDADL